MGQCRASEGENGGEVRGGGRCGVVAVAATADRRHGGTSRYCLASPRLVEFLGDVHLIKHTHTHSRHPHTHNTHRHTHIHNTHAHATGILEVSKLRVECRERFDDDDDVVGEEVVANNDDDEVACCSWGWG